MTLVQKENDKILKCFFRGSPGYIETQKVCHLSCDITWAGLEIKTTWLGLEVGHG